MGGRPARVLVATRNEGKLRELRPLFTGLGLPLLSLADAEVAERAEEDDLECFDTFEENALAKARYFHRLSGGLATVADDSGLAVDALGGAPGVRSKRWSGSTESGHALDAANNALLLDRLVGAEDRRARFVCAAAYVDADCELVVRGEVRGTILHEASGEHGFGYDPYFRADELGMSFGEATVAMKERVSHRARAFRTLAAELERRWQGSAR